MREICLSLLLLAIAGCQVVPVKQETVVFGTRVVITIIGAEVPQADAAIASVFARFNAMHERFHPWRKGGELQEINARIAAGTLPISLSAPMAEVIRDAQRYSAYSEGLFNPGVGALVRLWGFHSDTLPIVPPPAAAVAALLAQGVDIAALQLRENHLLAVPMALQLDFGAQAKGTALDIARAILLRHGIDHALIDIGGNLMAVGKNGNRPWRVAVRPDRAQPPLAMVELHDGEAVATSGGSERYFIHEGRRYSHVLDPRTGYPADAVPAAVVIAGGENAGAVSDAAATALLIADVELARRMLPRFGVEMAWQVGRMPTDAMQQRMRAAGTRGVVWK